MSRFATNADRVEQRAWLRQFLRSGLVDRVPLCLGEGGDRGPRADAHARRLLVELMDPDASSRSTSEVLADVRALRAWVEAHQRRSRRIILAEGRDTDSRAAELATEIVLGLTRPRPAVSERPAPPRSAGEHPMWDRWMDG